METHNSAFKIAASIKNWRLYQKQNTYNAAEMCLLWF